MRILQVIDYAVDAINSTNERMFGKQAEWCESISTNTLEFKDSFFYCLGTFGACEFELEVTLDISEENNSRNSLMIEVGIEKGIKKLNKSNRIYSSLEKITYEDIDNLISSVCQ